MKEKKSKKKIIIAVVVVFLILPLLIGSLTEEATPTTTAETTIAETTPEVPQRAEAIGKSDGKISDYADSITPSAVRDDATGNWRLVRVATSDSNFEKYAVDYYKTYFETNESTEVHWIINFTNKTTTSIKCMSGCLFVDTFEYVENEEHSAKTIGSGMSLTSYIVYLDNGDIEKV